MEWYICHRLIRQGSNLKMYGNKFSLCPTVVGVRLRRIENFGLVVQLVRIPACHAGGREFESRPDRNKFPRRWESLSKRELMMLCCSPPEAEDVV